MTDELQQLRDQLKSMTAERNELHAKLVDLRLDDLENKDKDKETRIRELEKIATRSNTLYALATGGGILSIIAIFQTLAKIP